MPCLLVLKIPIFYKIYVFNNYLCNINKYYDLLRERLTYLNKKLINYSPYTNMRIFIHFLDFF